MPEICKNPDIHAHISPKPEAYLLISAVDDGFMEARNKEHLFSQSTLCSLNLI